jgi:hypothetical protein
LEFDRSVLGSLCIRHSDTGGGATKCTLNLKGLSQIMSAVNIDRQGDGMKSSNAEESESSDLTLKFKGNCRQQQSTDYRHIFF